MDSIIESLQKTKSYTVTEVGVTGESQSVIDNYRAINSKHEEDKVVEEIATADTAPAQSDPISSSSLRQ